MSKAAERFVELTEIMAKLRDPETGCPWDIEQDFASIVPYTIEEAYEVADAVERGDMGDLRDELGDLALQVVFHSQMASEAGTFDIADVLSSINAKMIRRHPHVFGDASVRSAAEQTVAWEELKARERAGKTSDESSSALDGVANALPALTRAEKLQKRAARTGFDWTNPEDIFDKLNEEMDEVREAIVEQDADHIAEEIGDLLFVCANLSRRLGVDPEIALRAANRKFERRFKAMEKKASQNGDDFTTLTPEKQETLWASIKSDEK